jgi:hypothetical protein
LCCSRFLESRDDKVNVQSDGENIKAHINNFEGSEFTERLSETCAYI